MGCNCFEGVLITLFFTTIFAKNIDLCPQNCVCYSEEVNCQNRNFTLVPDHLNQKIKTLNLNHNRISDIPIRLSKLHNLENLILSHNQIRKLDKTHLNLTSLLDLDLSFNNFTSWNQIQPDSLNFTESIQTLDLSYNLLGPLNVKYLLKSPSLEFFNLKNCAIGSFLPKLFLSELPNLKRFVISENYGLRELDYVFSSSLEMLDASNCGLESINLANFPNLKEAIFRGSRMGYLKKEYLKNYKLQYLDLTDNGIKFINKNVFANLPELRTLHLSMNVFVNLSPETFVNNINLENLFISHTYLKNLVPFTSASLTNLDLSMNEIQNFYDDSLTSMPALKHLNLYRNLISRLPNQILAHALEYLNLSSCQIIGIKENTFSKLMLLHFLDLSNNRLTSFRRNYLPQSLTQINLDKNLWRCECYSVEFKEQYDSLMQPYEIADHNSLICHSPENVSGLSWDEACGPVWDAINNSKVQQGKMWMYVITMVLAMSVIFCATMCIRRMHQVKRMQEEAERLRLRQEAQERIDRLRREQQRQREAQQNAPDPRELQRPPSYHEAIRMPRIDGSYVSLAGSRASMAASRHSVRASRASIATTRGSAAASNPELSKILSEEPENQERSESKLTSGKTKRSRTPRGDRRRRRRRSRAGTGFETQSVPDLAAGEEVTDSILVDSERNETGQPSESINNDDNNANNNNARDRQL